MPISIHVFGGTKGESVVLEFPDGSYGVVDCHTGASNDLEKNPVVQFLNERKIDELDFVCLTHPHDDHFSGIKQLFENFTVSQFWHFDAMSTDRLREFIKVRLKEDTASSKKTGRANNALKLAELWKYVLSREKSGGLITQRLSLGQCCVPSEDSRGFTIDAIGTSAAQSSRFEQKLKHAFDNQLKFDARMNHRDPNICSCGLLIIHGATRILLGGDIETGGWSDLITQRSYMAKGINYVKVAHHGSPNGYADGLWELHREAVDITYKVLTPYKRFDLPKAKTIEHLERNGGRVFSAGNPYFDHEFVPTFVSSLKALRKKRIATRTPSRVSFTFDEHGKMTDHELINDAVQIC